MQSATFKVDWKIPIRDFESDADFRMTQILEQGHVIE